MLTAQSCRDLAASDRTRAAEAGLSNSRRRFETSAAAWSERADMLEHIGRLNASRRAPERVFDLG